MHLSIMSVAARDVHLHYAHNCINNLFQVVYVHHAVRAIAMAARSATVRISPAVGSGL